MTGLLSAEKQQFIDNQCQRNAVEVKTGPGKRRFGLGLIREKLPATQVSTIALNVLVINLEKLMELLFVLLTSWPYFLLNNQFGKKARLVCLCSQLSSARRTGSNSDRFGSFAALPLALFLRKHQVSLVEEVEDRGIRLPALEVQAQRLVQWVQRFPAPLGEGLQIQ